MEWLKQRFTAWFDKPGSDTAGNGTSVSSEEQSSQKRPISGTCGLPEVCEPATTPERNIPLRALSLQIFVMGQTFGSEQQFINRVDQNLRDSGVKLRREDYDQHSGRLLLLFCPVVSRIGTDISNALESIAAGRDIILVVMHHVPNESLTLHTNSRSQIQSSAVVGSVDCRFSQASGLYSSEMNTKAVLSVTSMVRKQVDMCK